MGKNRKRLLSVRMHVAALLLVFLCGSQSVQASDTPGFEERLKALEIRQKGNEDALDSIAAAVRRRSGLISEDEARKRYEGAVFSSLMGDYETAALEFYILLESGAVSSPVLVSDTEWYLAETLFELGNYVTAKEAYNRILEKGHSHPFFSDAVRRLLEIYGITGENVQFSLLYDKYIATHEVAPSELVNYTLAKSFYRQGDWQRAVALFGGFPPESLHYGKARYFLGTIDVRQGELENAATEFKLAAQTEIRDSDSRELVDLANLALGRVYYEMGDYLASQRAYELIGRESKYFADRLYELVWNFIKQEAYEEAIREIEIFLLAFPEHKYAARLKIYKGHLHWKQSRYESAHTAYENVVTEYTPIRDLLKSVEDHDEQSSAFFDRLAEEDALDVLNRFGLPPYAVEMLYAMPEVGTVVDIRREVQHEQDALENVTLLIDELESALLAGLDTLGSFRSSRDSVRWIQSDRFGLVDELLNLEADYFFENTSGTIRSQVQRLRQERGLVTDAVEEAKRGQEQHADRAVIYEEQVRAVQTQACLVEQVAQDIVKDIQSTRDYLDLGQHELSPAEERRVRADLNTVEEELGSVVKSLKPLQSDVTLQRLVGSISMPDLSFGAESREQAMADYESLRVRLKELRPQVERLGSTEFFKRLDGIWASLDGLDQKAEEVGQMLDKVEKEEIRRIQKGLAHESAIVDAMRRDVNQASQETNHLGALATREGFKQLGDFFDDSVMRADMGIVDVYWARKVQVSDRIDQLNRERVDLLKDLDKQFQTINAKLEN